MMCLKFLLTVIFWGVSCSLFSQKPAWVNNTPKEGNSTYKFIEIVSYGSSLEAARVESKKLLATNEQLTRSVVINMDTEKRREIHQMLENGSLRENVRDTVVVCLNIKGRQFRLQANKVDEYAIRERGMYKLHTLFMVALCDNPLFDNTYFTSRYGCNGLWRSVICPGWGQIYKGSKARGIVVLGAEILAIGGIVYVENERSSYEVKMRSQPRFAKTYKTKVDNYETARNCCIGAAIAIYIYNLVDAVASPGARQVKVKSNGFSLNGVYTSDFRGVSLAFTF